MLARAARVRRDNRVADAESLSAELVARCRAELADYKTPDAWTWLAEPLPRNANGKVLKRALRERVEGRFRGES